MKERYLKNSRWIVLLAFLCIMEKKRDKNRSWCERIIDKEHLAILNEDYHTLQNKCISYYMFLQHFYVWTFQWRKLILNMQSKSQLTYKFYEDFYMPQYFYYIYKFYMPQYYFLIAKVGAIHCKKLLFNNMSCEETFGVWRVFFC